MHTAVTMSLRLMLPQASSDLPENLGRADLSRTSPTHPRQRLSPCEAGLAVRSVLLFGLAPGDAYPAIHVAMDAVGSYPTVSPLPRHHPKIVPGRFAFCGAHVGLLRLGVTQHPALWSPDFPLTCEQMSGHLTHALIPGNYDTQYLFGKQETYGRKRCGYGYPSMCS